MNTQVTSAIASNPVIPGFHPDPSVCRVGDDFYLVTSSFEYFPGVPIFHSRDLAHWEQVGFCLTRDSQLRLQSSHDSGGIYAPTIRHDGTRFHMITTNVSINKHLMVSADDPAGEWSDPIELETGGIDPSLFFDDDQKVYLAHTGCGGIVQAQIDLRTGDLLSPLTTIWSGTGGKAVEGPHLYKINGWYYLLVAEGGTEYGHMVTIARSRSVWGPFDPCPRNPILTHRSIDHVFQCIGHADLFDDRHGNWWAVCLATRPQGYPPRHHLGRETALMPVRWDAEGWPVLGDSGRLPREPFRTGFAPTPARARVVRDDFDQPTLSMDWNHLRNPLPEQFSLTDRLGYLRLFGSAADMRSESQPAWVGRRHQHLKCRMTTVLQFRPSTPTEEAGLCLRMNHLHHYQVALTKGRVFVRLCIGPVQHVLAEHAYDQPRVFLRVTVDPFNYVFWWSGDGAEWHQLGTAETRYLATEIAGGFTGVYCGPYATGNGSRCVGPADFDWFDYEPLDDVARAEPER